jgi:hypothetical protein
VTEKLYRAYLRGQVPVYRGAPNVAELAPPHSYVDAHDFATPADLAKYLVYLAGNDTAYNEYQAWRHSSIESWPAPFRTDMLRIMRHVHLAGGIPDSASMARCFMCEAAEEWAATFGYPANVPQPGTGQVKRLACLPPYAAAVPR